MKEAASTTSSEIEVSLLSTIVTVSSESGVIKRASPKSRFAALKVPGSLLVTKKSSGLSV